MKKFALFLSCILLLTFLTGCSGVGDRSFSISVIYGICAALSLLLLILAPRGFKREKPWFILLFSSVFIVNSGYFLLSLSKDISLALWANRLSYFGSALLPITMLFIILSVCEIKAPKWLPYLLFSLGIAVFLIAASPGYSDIYYKEVSLGSYNGATVLEKTYGPWHPVWLVYLVGYTATTVAFAILSIIRKKVKTPSQVFTLTISVVANIALWLLEQLVLIEFELLSVSYIITEIFLFNLYTMQDKYAEKLSEKAAENVGEDNAKSLENLEIFKKGIAELTKTESIIYTLYTQKKTTKEVMAELDITENTLKYHNKNIYSKLGVSSRKQLCSMATSIENQE